MLYHIWYSSSIETGEGDFKSGNRNVELPEGLVEGSPNFKQMIRDFTLALLDEQGVPVEGVSACGCFRLN